MFKLTPGRIFSRVLDTVQTECVAPDSVFGVMELNPLPS